jgi:hypothetical protein
MRAHEMEEWKARDAERGNVDDDETLLPAHEFDPGSISDDDDDDDDMSDAHDERSTRRGGAGIKGYLWVGLCTAATLAGRRMLINDFRKLIVPWSFFSSEMPTPPP